jgi:hypothetical protein
MNALFDWFNPTRIIIVLGLALALLASVLGYGEWRASSAKAGERQKWQAALDRQKVEAAGVLADETRNVLRLERTLALITSQLELEDAKRSTIRADYERRLAAAAVDGRLRDPNARCGGGGGGAQAPASTPAGGGDPGGAEAGGLLSAQLTGLLQRASRDSDEINDAYAACRGWALGVKANFPGGEQLPSESEAANQPTR